MTVRVDLVPKPPYAQPTAIVDVFSGSVVGILLASAKEVWITKSARAARIFAGERALLFGELEGLPPEGFHHGTSLQALEQLELEGKTCVLLAPSLAETLAVLPLASILAYFRNARAAVGYAADHSLDTVVAVPQARLEPSLANTVAAGFIAKRLQQALGQQGVFQEGARLATVLLKSFPDPQEALFQSELGQQMFRAGHTEDIALASIVSSDEVIPQLVDQTVLSAAKYGLTKDRPLFCFRSRP